MRNINWELKTLKPTNNIQKLQNNWAQSIRQKIFKWFYCPECGKHLYGDNSVLQNHMMEIHIRERASNADRGWKFSPQRSII